MPLVLAGMLAACGGDSSDDLVVVSESARADFAASRIDSSADASLTCTTPGAACDAEIAALTDSAFNAMSPFVDGLDMAQLEDAIGAGVSYSVQTGLEYDELEFTYTNPTASQGTTVTINGGLNADGYASTGSTPVNNDNQGVYADESAPQADPNGDAGWYFINASAGDKVNYYFYADGGAASQSYTMDDLRSLEAVTKLYKTSTDYFFNIYTLRENDGNDAGSFYRSRITLTSGDFPVASAPATYTGEFNRDAAVTGDLEFTVGGTTLYSTGNSSLADIGAEEIFLIALGTNSGAAAGDIELTATEFTLGLQSGDVVIKPVAASEVSEQLFRNTFDAIAGDAGADMPFYLEITSGTDAFNGLVFEIAGGRTTFTASLVGGADLTLAQSILLEKLDRGDGYNALVPEAVFDPETESLVFDFGTALELADITGLTATIYNDAGLTEMLGDISIDADGRVTTLSYP